MIKDLPKIKSNQEDILIADIPYDLPTLGTEAWNKLPKGFIHKFTGMITEKFTRFKQTGQSLIFGSWDQTRELQKAIGGKLLFCIQDHLSDPEKLKEKRLHNKVQTCLYTLYGDHRKQREYGFENNVITYSYEPGERLYEDG
eukprot:Nk52_evm1s1766 gene=Nk52_evmTU1s1766